MRWTHRTLHIQRAGAEFGRLGYITILVGLSGWSNEDGEAKAGVRSEEFGAETDGRSDGSES